MSHTISKDHAVTAMILWSRLLEAAERQAQRHGDKKAFIADYGTSSARYAVIEMAAEVEEVFRLLPEEEIERLSEDDFVHSLILDCFDYGAGPVPKLKTSHEAVADWIEANFGRTDVASPTA